MMAGFALIDYLVMGAALVTFLALGVRAGRGIDGSDAFLLAGREAGWPAVSASLAVFAPAALFILAAPQEGYWVGLKLLLVPAMLWVALPLVFWCVIPLVHNLDLDSVYEYVELRFDPTTRAAASGLFCVGQLLWIGGFLALPASVLCPSEGLGLSAMLVVVGVGAATTAYTYFGGMRAGVWTDVLQVGLLAGALVVLLAALATNLEGGYPRIWQVASDLNRTQIVGHSFAWSEEWSAVADRFSAWSSGWNLWAAVLYLGVAGVFFFSADQSTVQRFIAVRDDRDMALSYVCGGAGACLLLPLAMFAGMGLLAVYHDNAQAEIPPQWVANSAVDTSGKPLVGPDTPLDADHLDALIEAGAILNPTTDKAFTDKDKAELLNPRGEVVVDRLALRAPPRLGGGERLLRRGGDRSLAHFLGRHLALGLAGLVAVGLLGLAMAAVDSGLIGLATVVMVDMHRREGHGEAWLARQCDKDPDNLDQTDEMRLCRPLVLVLGAIAVVIGLVVAAWGSPVPFLMATLGIFAGPLAGVFLLGLLTRRATGAAATASLWLGVAAALWATLGHYLAQGVLGVIWPFTGPLGVFWPMSFGFATTLVLGFFLSFFAGERKSKKELSGLVLGLGRWGILLEAEKDEIYLRPAAEPEPPKKESPWR